MALSRKYVLVFAIVAIAGSLLYFSFDPSLSEIFPKCFFHSLTNLDCPGCGSQRAIHALLHGNIAEAADQNLLVLLFLPLLTYSATTAVGNTFFGRNWKQPLFYSTIFVRSVLAFVLLFWILRNLSFGPLEWLSAGT
jgi:Protein of unknown function (DUF2752)